MICKHCNQDNEPGSRFCASCGQPLDVPEEVNQTGENSFNQPPVQPPSSPSNQTSGQLEKPLTIAMFACIVPYAVKLLITIPAVLRSFGALFNRGLITGLISFVICFLTLFSCLLMGGVLFLSAKSSEKSKSHLMLWGVSLAAVLRVAICIIQLILYALSGIGDSYNREWVEFSPKSIIFTIIFAVLSIVVAYGLFVIARNNPFSFNFSKDMVEENLKNSIDFYKNEVSNLTNKESKNAQVGNVPNAQNVNAPKLLKTNRSLIAYIFLSAITCGIYGLLFFDELSRAANTICEGDGEHTPGLLKYILFTLLTCGIYTFVWDYKLGNRLAANAPRYNQHISETGSTILMWRIFGVLLCGIGVFVAFHIELKNLNMLSTEYNKNAMMEFSLNNAKPH